MSNRKITQLPVLSSATDEDIIPIVDDSELTTKQIQVGDLLADQITEAERTKLTGIAEGATANQTDAYLLNRANQTGTQPASSISDFNTQEGFGFNTHISQGVPIAFLKTVFPPSILISSEAI